MRNNKGFTLIELLTVLALLAVMAMIVIPNVSRDMKYLESATNDLLYEIRFAREESMRNLEGKAKTVEILDSNSYRNAQGETIKLRKNYSIDFTSTAGRTIKFTNNGTSSEFVKITIKKNDGSETKTICINKLGNAYIE